MSKQAAPRSPRFQTANADAGPRTTATTFQARPPVKKLAKEDTLTKEQAAEYAHVSSRTISRWLAQGSLNRYVLRINLVAVSKTELDALLSARHEA